MGTTGNCMRLSVCRAERAHCCVRAQTDLRSHNIIYARFSEHRTDYVAVARTACANTISINAVRRQSDDKPGIGAGAHHQAPPFSTLRGYMCYMCAPTYCQMTQKHVRCWLYFLVCACVCVCPLLALTCSPHKKTK